MDQQKLCLLCRQSDDAPYTETSAALHEKFGLHLTDGRTWAPMKGHELYELHVRYGSLVGYG